MPAWSRADGRGDRRARRGRAHRPVPRPARSDRRSALTTVAGAVLCGGASRRMGADKALVEVGGRAMALVVADAVATGGCAPVIAVGGAPLDALGLRTIADQFPGEGPLGGALTALYHFADRWVLVVSCDLPRLRATTVAGLVARAEAAADDPTGPVDLLMATTDRDQPLCAVWAPWCADVLRRAFADGERSLRRVIPSLHVSRVSVDAAELADVDTPDDLRQAATEG
ncbi:MAG: molybdenum cofactor guanylyltransferase [Ilumatobacteraceae bacterium]